MAIALGTEIITQLKPMECGECGIVFAISEAKYNRCRQSGEGWYCPNGHSRVFSSSENTELKYKVERLEREVQRSKDYIQEKNHQILQLNYSVRAQKAAKTKILNRVKNGVCPCCNRTFANLQNHFKSKHPELLNP